MPMGFAPISHRPVAMLVDMTLPVAVAVPPAGVEINYTLQLYPSGGAMIAAAAMPFATLPSDTLANQPFAGTLRTGLTFRRTIVDGAGFGKVSGGYGEIELENGDAGYDATFQANTIDGRRALIRFGQIDPGTRIPTSFDTYAVLLDGIAEDWHLDDSVLRITLRDNGFRLDAPASPNTYGGTGGVDGTAELAGKRKPRTFGIAINVTPALIDPANLVYQVNDGGVHAVSQVLDGAYALVGPDADYATYAALIAASVIDGHYVTCKALGLFRLGATPFKLITASVEAEDALVAGSAVDTATIARALLRSTSISLVDEGSFAALSAAQGAIISYYLGLDEAKTVRQALDELMAGIGGWYGFRLDGAFEVGRLVAPGGSAFASVTAVDIVAGSLKRLALPEGVNPPPRRWRVAYARNWTVQTDLMGAVPASTAETLKAPYAIAEPTNTALMASIAAAHLLAQDPEPIPAFFAYQPSAAAEADRLLTLYGGATRSLYAFQVTAAKGLNLVIGHVISVTYPRFDLGAGKLLVVVGTDVNTTAGTIEVTAWG